MPEGEYVLQVSHGQPETEINVTLPAQAITDGSESIESVSDPADTEPQSVDLDWSTPGAIGYGTALGASQLNAAASAVAGTIDYIPPVGSVLPAGEHTLRAVFSPADPAFADTTGRISLRVNQAPLTIRATDKTKVQGAANPPLTLTYEGFVNGETPADLDSPPDIATPANTSSPAGEYPITVTGAADLNYSITQVGGVLIVTDTADPGTPQISLQRIGASVQFSWKASDGYVLYSSPNLRDWTPTAGVIEQGGNATFLLSTIASRELYYRLQK